MQPAQGPLVWQGRLQIGNEPAAFGDAARAGAAVRILCPVRRGNMKSLGIALIALVGCQQGPSVMADRPRVVGSGSAAPASEMGETPAAKQFDAWLAVFNKGDRAALVAYHAQQFPYAVA